MRKHSISIALCTYNGARYIEEQLRSIFAQTLPANEIVICDDGSSDTTLHIVETLSRTSPVPLKVTRNAQTLRSTKNFEQAIGLCQGELIFFSDQDDVWMPNKLEVLVGTFERFPETDAVFSNARVVGEQLQDLGYTLWESVRFSASEQRLTQDGKPLSTLLRHNVVTGATMGFRARWRDVIVPIPQETVHDAWIALLIAAAGNLRLVNENLILYRQHAGNQIGGRRRGLIERFKRSRNDHGVAQALKQFEEAAARLKEHNLLQDETLAHALAQKKIHLEGRVRFTSRHRGGVGSFLREILSRRYHKYSMGWWSVAHDLARRLSP